MRRFILSLTLLLAGSGWAAVNEWGFNFQAELVDKEGNPYCDDRGRPIRRQTVEVRLYDKETKGTALWERSFIVFTDASGRFNVFLTDAAGTRLGTSSATLESVFVNHVGGGLYVGVTRAGDTDGELTPRTRLCSVPSSMRASVSRSLAGTLNDPAFTEGALTVGDSMTVSSNMVVAGDMTVSGECSVGKRLLNNGHELIGIPVGGIILWANATKGPDGKNWNDNVSADGRWAICDGMDGRPNLSGRFPLGVKANTYTLGKMGGGATVTLVEKNLPRHYHPFVQMRGARPPLDKMTSAGVDDSYFGFNRNTVPLGQSNPIKVGDDYLQYWEGEAGTKSSLNKEKKDKDNDYPLAHFAHTGSTGGAKEHNNIPPYYGVMFVIRIK